MLTIPWGILSIFITEEEISEPKSAEKSGTKIKFIKSNSVSEALNTAIILIMLQVILLAKYETIIPPKPISGTKINTQEILIMYSAAEFIVEKLCFPKPFKMPSKSISR